MFGSKDLLFSAEKYGVAKSLRFRASASAYLSRTLASNSTSSTTLTWSMWVKRGLLSSANRFLLAYNGTSAGTGNMVIVEFFQDNIRCFFDGAATNSIVTSQVFRDPSAWYHIVFAYDTTQATASNRAKLYVNGAQVTAFSTANYPALNQAVNAAATNVQYIGVLSANYFDGYMAEVNFIDGQALTPSSFGFYDNTGVWQPKGYTGTYGTNGVYLKFTDVGATSGANTGYGKDFAGTNYFTTNNFGTTSTATTYDSMYDSPVNASNGITGIGNYCTWNAVTKSPNMSITAANLNTTAAGATTESAGATFGLTSGKWYWEVTPTTVVGSFPILGIANANEAGLRSISAYYPGFTANSWGLYCNTGGFANNNTVIATYSTFAANDVMIFALDMDNGKYWMGKNGTWFNSGVPASGTGSILSSGLTGQTIFPMVGEFNGSSASANFGQRPFAYTPPSGFSAINTQNLTAPTIANGAGYMAAVTYTGTGSSQTITASSTNSGNNPTGTTFQPDFVWVKGRSGATDHALYDVVRGVQKQLESNTTTAETTETTGLTAFTSSGFTTGALAQMNTNTATYVAWEWSANGAGVSNTSGSITSTVSANQTAGFSVVTYTGTGANATVGHGLGVAPSMMIFKTRTNGATNWAVYHISIGNTTVLALNLTNATFAASAAYFNNTSPDNTKFTVGTGSTVNANTENYVAYCFAPVAGYSAFGSYTGNGLADGPFIYTGFRPRWLMVKNTSTAATDWFIVDSSINTYNVVSALLVPNSSGAEVSSLTICDFLSNGFKFRDTNASRNASGSTYIYAAFAENPFRIARAR